MKKKECCERMKDLLSSEEGLTIYPEGNIFVENSYVEIELIYCPYCGKKVEREKYNNFCSVTE